MLDAGRLLPPVAWRVVIAEELGPIDEARALSVRRSTVQEKSPPCGDFSTVSFKPAG
jgi:hypothetical protein